MTLETADALIGSAVIISLIILVSICLIHIAKKK